MVTHQMWYQAANSLWQVELNADALRVEVTYDAWKWNKDQMWVILFTHQLFIQPSLDLSTRPKFCGILDLHHYTSPFELQYDFLNTCSSSSWWSFLETKRILSSFSMLIKLIQWRWYIRDKSTLFIFPLA